MMLKSNSVKKVFIVTAFLLFAFVFLSEAAVDPVVVELHYQNGVKYYKRGLYDKAAAEFQKTLRLVPDHQEAKEYLDRAIEASDREAKELADSSRSKDEKLKQLYREGRSRYKARDYEGAIDVFDEILKIKPVDDFASFYKEKCEIILSKKLAREKKIQEKQRIREEKIAKRQARLEEARAKREARKKKPVSAEKNATSVADKSKPDSEEIAALTNSILEAKKKETSEEAPVLKQEQEKLTPKQVRAEQKRKAREEKLKAKEERRLEKLRKKQERIQAKKDAREKAKRVKKASAQTKKIEKAEKRQEYGDLKELFLKGVEYYGRRDFQNAIDTFNTVIESEKDSEKKSFTDSAVRMLNKAQRRLEQVDRKE